MEYSFYQICWIFILYSFLGWCCEVVFAAAVDGKFVNRGFLNGPVCPIYGFGILSIVLCLEPLKDNFILLFAGSVLFTSLLEFVTGWTLERFFHQKWWDYSNTPFNIKGYICLRFSLLWGLAGVFVIDIIHPMIKALIAFIPDTAGKILLCVLLTAFAADFSITLVALLNLPKKLRFMQEFGETLHAVSDKIGENLSEGTINVIDKNEKLKIKIEAEHPELKEKFEKHKNMPKKNIIQKRLLNAFPDLSKKDAGIRQLRDFFNSKIKNNKK